MKKVTLPLLVTALGFMQQQAVAQNDSAYLDLLRYRTSQQSVQSFTITGEQLSRMPYTDLGQAIGVWMAPALATGSNTVFMVDGTLVNDVNIYSIQDVAMVTFVQSGPGQMMGLTRAQQYLVLIITKRNTSGQLQWRAAGATAYVNQLGDASAKAGFYHQYSLSVSNGTRKFNYGASMGYTHDVFPQTADYAQKKQNPLRQNRYRVNAWLDAVVAQNHTFRLDAAYLTQRHTNKNSGTWATGDMQDEDLLNKDHVLNLKASVSSSLGAGFTNHIGADFYDVNFKGDETQSHSPSGSIRKPQTDNHSRNWMIEERFSYKKRYRGQYFMASADARYRHIDYSSAKFTGTYTYYPGGLPTAIALQQSWQATGAKSLYITPTVAWGVDGMVDVQAGVLYSALKDDMDNKHFFPFASASVDVLHCVSKNAPVSLRLYSSIAAVKDFPELSWVKLSNLSQQTDLLDPGASPLEGAYLNPYVVYDVRTTKATRFQGGARLGLLQNRLLFDYSYNKSGIPSYQYVYVSGQYTGTQANTPYVRHRAAVSVKTDSDKFNWLGVLSFNWVKSRTELPFFTVGGAPYLKTRNSFTTAGFANRLTYGSWFGAVDVVAAFNKMSGGKNRNAATLQELHVGRKFTPKAASVELYAFTRTPFNNTIVLLADIRRYYGVGCTATF